jgi:Flp pilus assembly protein TadG
MRRAALQLWKSESGSVAPIVAISLFALIGAAGIGFDYARMASLDTELQDAADHAALAAASQLDGKSDSITRATAAAQNLFANNTRFANDGTTRGVVISGFTFYASYDQSADAYGTVTTDPKLASVVKVSTAGREAFFALTPIVGAIRSGSLTGSATAGIGQAICKVPPVMICNPDESDTNTDLLADFTAPTGTGLRLVTGNADAAGNFGWLESNLGNGANALAEALGYDSPPGTCSPFNNVTTKTGMDASVLNALNTRFDVFAPGNTTCPNQDHGTCSPSANVRKDLACKAKNGVCTWEESPKPYRPTEVKELDGSNDPDMMGYPRDECHAVPAGTFGQCGITGDAKWDRAAYFRVNYGSSFDWQTTMSAVVSDPKDNLTRYQVYNWEIAHPAVAGHGISVPQSVGSDTGYGTPVSAPPGLTPGGANLDRRRISVAVLNCHAMKVSGKTSNVPVAKWLDVFLVEPSFQRNGGNGNKTSYTDQKEVYVEVIGSTGSGVDGTTNSQVVQRAVPYLIR